MSTPYRKSARVPFKPEKQAFWTLDAWDVGLLTAFVFVAVGVAVAEGVKIGKRRLEEGRR